MNYLTMLSKFLGFSGGSVVKNLFASAGGMGSVPGLGRSLEKIMATYSSILNGKAMDRGDWHATVLGVTKI